jgi:copper chaperone
MTTTNTFGVTGMTCEHCVAAVTEEVSRLSGVLDVSIDLVAGGVSSVHVVSDAALDEAEVRDALDEAGYALAADAS